MCSMLYVALCFETFSFLNKDNICVCLCFRLFDTGFNILVLFTIWPNAHPFHLFWIFAELCFNIGIPYWLSMLLAHQYYLLSKDVSGIEYLFDHKNTHGQFSKGTDKENLQYYLGATIFHLLWPCD